MEQQFNQTLGGGNDNTKGGNVRLVGLPTLPNEEADHIGNDVDELSKVGKIHNWSCYNSQDKRLINW